ncbi:putative membrane protein C6F6,04c [Talaromyces islandicus]|uniref:Putative membrane protein C6F6,04c n=1 Tax=Talaromyces islandicus TaxID=28573 RepID=A0A0U1LPI6_TALIS|nr:putative membrane protein C6F6,04c [Talaromyces islandicus]
MTDKPSPTSKDLELNQSLQPPEKKHWYRTTLFNAFVIGGVGFLAPGLWNAMNSLGAGGAEEPYLVNAANALVFGIMGFLCLFGGPIANRIGLAWTLVLSTLGYPIYSAGLYTNNRYGNVWFVLLGAVACGFSAGLFWAVEGAIALGYPEVSKRGKYMNIWLIFRTGGPLLGGAIVLGLNHSSEAAKKGSVGWQTYLVFVILQCLAAPLAYFLTPPQKVQRSDGSHIKVAPRLSFREEFWALWNLSKQKRVLLLLPLFWAAYFNQYNGIAWIYAWVVQEKYTREQPVFDWVDKGFVEGFFVLALWEFSRQSLQNWMYYMVSVTTDNISQLTRLSGILRGQESFAQAVSFGINTREWYGGRVPLAVNTILLGLAVLPTWIVVKDLNPDDIATDSDDPVQDEAQLPATVAEKVAVRDGL